MKHLRHWAATYASTGALLCALALTGCHSGEQNGSKPSSDAKGSGGGKQGSDSKGSDSKGGSSSRSGSDSKSGASDSKSGGSDTTSSQKEGSVPTDTVKIKAEDLSKAGIRIAAVTVRRMPQTLNVAGQVAMDEKHTSHIGVYADGRVQSVYVLPGDHVRRGQTLATLHSHMVHETAILVKQAFDAAHRQASAVAYATQVRDRYAKLYSIQSASRRQA